MELTIKQSVVLSFLWSLSNSLCLDRVMVKKDNRGNMIGQIPIYTSKKAPNDFRIACLGQCIQLDEKTTNVVEDLKIKVWDELADKYDGQNLTLDIITALESLYYDNSQWLDKINPNFHRWIESMSLKMIDPKLDPKFSRKAADQFVQILNKVLYDENRNK